MTTSSYPPFAGDPHYHVIPAVGGGWAVKRRSFARASRRFAERTDAIAWARDRARDVVVHRSDGTIGWTESWFTEDGVDVRTKGGV